MFACCVCRYVVPRPAGADAGEPEPLDAMVDAGGSDEQQVRRQLERTQTRSKLAPTRSSEEAETEARGRDSLHEDDFVSLFNSLSAKQKALYVHGELPGCTATNAFGPTGISVRAPLPRRRCWQPWGLRLLL